MIHTPEPWKVDDSEFPAIGNVVDCDNEQVCQTSERKGYTAPLSQLEIRKANAARIVACVNACAGMEDPAAEIQALRMDLADYIAQHHCQVQQIARLKADADKRAEALRWYADEDHYSNDDWNVPSVISPPEYGNPGQIARAALAAHERTNHE